MLIEHAEITSRCTVQQLQKLKPYAEVFSAFDSLVDACFHSSELTVPLDTIQELLDVVIEKNCATKLSIIPKMHILFNHLMPILERSGVGLGLYSAQSGESCHREFLNNFWCKYKIKDTAHPNYANQLFKVWICLNQLITSVL